MLFPALLLWSGACSSVRAAYITRDDVVSSAQLFISTRVTLSADNLVLGNGGTCDSRFNGVLDVPMCVGQSFPGVAYKWGGFDSVAQYQSKAAAGKIVASLDDGEAFTGADCSGFIARVWNQSMPPKLGTSNLNDLSMEVGWESLRRGDIVLVANDPSNYNHVVLLYADYGGGTANIAHAASKHFGPNWTIGAMRVVNDQSVPVFVVSGTLRRLQGLQRPMSPRSAFPQFDAFDPGDGGIIGVGNPTVSVRVRSKHAIQTPSIALEIDGSPVSGLSVTGSGVEVTVSGSPSSPLTDGAHTLSVTAANDLNLIDTRSIGFTVATSSPPAPSLKNSTGTVLPHVIASTNCVTGIATDSTSGVDSVALISSSGGVVAQQAFDCPTTADYGPFCNLAADSYAIQTTNCVQLSSSTSVVVSTVAAKMAVCTDGSCVDGDLVDMTILKNTSMRLSMTSDAVFSGAEAVLAEKMFSGPGIFQLSCPPMSACYATRTLSNLSPSDYNYKITNATDVASRSGFSVDARLYLPNGDPGPHATGTCASFAGASPGASCTAIVKVPQGGSYVITASSATTSAPLSFITLARRTACSWINKILAVFRVPATDCYGLNASDFVFTSTATLTFTFADNTGIGVDTATARVFRVDGVDWSSAGVTMIGVSKDTTTNIVSATATYTRSGEYGLFFIFPDTVPPTTTLSFQGSTSTFDGSLFLSSQSVAFLNATDPPIGTFASAIASVTFRVDASTTADPFSVYSGSISFTPGTHTLEYRSIDYAGNLELTKTATFTVTSGSALREGRGATVVGNLLLGARGVSARAETVGTLTDSLVVLVSSANRQGVDVITTDGAIGVGLTSPVSVLNVSVGAIGLAVRVGNSAPPASAVQIAFGLNGDVSYRHALRTEHSTATDSNRMDFLLWNAAAASTTTLASRAALSLQGIAAASNGSFHVVPVGQPDVELEVSNGSSVGGGTIQYAHYQSPSSRRFKTDISYLSEKDEDRAAREVGELRHARFRYKALRNGTLVDDPAQPLRVGLIYEEAPESIRDQEGALSSNERLANAELALKAAMRRLEKLRARYDELKARRRP